MMRYGLILLLLLAAVASEDVVDKFTVRLWNDAYYAKVTFPDGTKQELKSDNDLTYGQWQERIAAAWEAAQQPDPNAPVLLDAATLEQVAALVKERGWTAKDLGLQTVMEPIP